MKKQAHFIRLYKRLNLKKSASITDLKNRYHHLARMYHPDKSAQNDSLEDSDATELFQEIQSIYKELKQYHNIYGHLPLDSPPTPQASQRSYSAQLNTLPRQASQSIKIIHVILILLIVLLFFIPSQDETSRKSEINNPTLSDIHNNAQLQQNESNPDKKNVLGKSSDHPIKIGMSMGEVFDLLGVPDATINDQWFYGKSEIYFRDGLVAGWSNNPDSPIWTEESLPRRITPPPRPIP